MTKQIFIPNTDLGPLFPFGLGTHGGRAEMGRHRGGCCI